MKKQIISLSIFLISLTTLLGQVEQQSLPSTKEIINRRSIFNLDEIKVRWKKAALENCPGIPCVTTTVPGPPTSVVATAGNASASVAFAVPANNGGSAITGYTVTSSPGGITATGATSPINVTGLTNGTAYTFTVIATNAVGNSVASSASTGVTPVSPNTVPGPPTSVVATAGNASASVAFVAPSNNGGSAITGYTVTSSPGGITATGATSPINVTGLTNGTAYTFTVIATNAVGNSVASSASTAVTPVVPVCPASTVTDVDNNIYNTVAIGTQCWTKQNLKVTKYNDGTLIPDETTSPGSNWAALTTGARTEYVGSILTSSGPAAIINYVGTYGYLYNWFAVVDSRKLCPTGWHVPSDSEWSILLNVLDITSNPNPGFPFIESSTAGGKMKANIDWNGRPALGGLLPPDPQATNSSGFSAFPAGTRNITGLPGSYSSAFSLLGTQAFFQSSTPDSINPLAAFNRNLVDSNSNVSRDTNNKAAGLSVRCIKD